MGVRVESGFHMAVSIDQFGKAAVAAGLLSPDDLKTLWSSFSVAERPKGGETLSKLLVVRGLLNEFGPTPPRPGRRRNRADDERPTAAR